MLMSSTDSEMRVSTTGLKLARKRLVQLEDAHIDEDDYVPQWVRTCRLLVDSKLEEVSDDE